MGPAGPGGPASSSGPGEMVARSAVRYFHMRQGQDDVSFTNSFKLLIQLFFTFWGVGVEPFPRYLIDPERVWAGAAAQGLRH